MPVTSPCDNVRYLIFKLGKRGLNSQLRPILRERGGNGSHTLPNHVTGNGWSTRHSRGVITLRPSALLEIFYFISHSSSTPNKNCTLLFLTGEDDIARFDSPQYNL